MELHNSKYEALYFELWSSINNYGAPKIIMELHNYGVLTLLALHTDMFLELINLRHIILNHARMST